MVRTLFATAFILLASTAQAQITTYVAPQRAPAPTREMIATADSVRRDSVSQVAMTNMKAWVDSAAGVPIPSHVGRIDSTALVNDPGRPVTTFSDGSVAPATASNLPTLVILGVLFFALGTVLLAIRPRV